MDTPFAVVPSAGRLAAHLTGTFVLTGLAWVLATDVLLYTLTEDPVLIGRIETAKGWAFVALAAGLLFCTAFVGVSRVARARRLLAAVIDSVGDGVLLIGRDRRIVHANPAALELLRARADEVVGLGAEAFSRRFRVSYPDGRLVPPDQFVSQRAFDVGATLRYQCELFPPGGPSIVLSSTGAPVLEQGDEPSMVVSVMHDITATERLRQLQDEFFAAAAHSLKTPIAVVSANAALLAFEGSGEARRIGEVIRGQCARLDAQVQNLLLLSRSHAGTLQLHPRLVDLAEVLQRVASDRAVATASRRVLVEHTEPVRAWVDDERLVTALRNVVIELAASTPATEVTLGLRRTGDEAEILARATIEPTAAPAGAPEAALAARDVTDIVVNAHGGRQGRDRTGAVDVRWIRLPAAEERPGA